MTFSYNPTESDDKDKVRGEVGDTVQNDGPRPSNQGGEFTNYADETIKARITAEGNWQRATASIFERLATEWARKANMNASGGGQSNSVQHTSTSEKYMKLAKLWRDRYGYKDDDDTVTESVSMGVMRLGFQATSD